MAVSILLDKVVPIDSEGEMFCPIIPVVKGKPGTDELAERVLQVLTLGPVVIARGHGTFAVGKNLDEAFVLTSLAEHSCRILSLISGMKREKND